MDKYFYLPGYYTYYNLITLIYSYKQAHLDYFIKDRIITGAYDLPYGLRWNGGRSIVHYQEPYDLQKVTNIMLYYQQNTNLILLHTCTNNLLTEADCYDPNANYFLDKFYRPQDKIIIASPLLKDYLQKKYQHISFVNSTTLGITDINDVNKITEHESYVLYYGKNNDNKYLSQIKHPENIEILCAENCGPNCPKRQEHYLLESQAMLGNVKPLEKFTCPFMATKAGFISRLIEQNDYMINNKRIEELSEMGFNHFKLSGRNYGCFTWLEMIVYYLVKPEYQALVHKELTNYVISNIMTAAQFGNAQEAQQAQNILKQVIITSNF